MKSEGKQITSFINWDIRLYSTNTWHWNVSICRNVILHSKCLESCQDTKQHSVSGSKWQTSGSTRAQAQRGCNQFHHTGTSMLVGGKRNGPVWCKLKQRWCQGLGRDSQPQNSIGESNEIADPRIFNETCCLLLFCPSAATAAHSLGLL